MKAYLPNAKQLSRLILLTSISIGMLVLKYFQLGEIKLMFLGWNLFLAWIPLIALYLINLKRNTGGLLSMIISLLLWCVWFVFYPNAPYLITDIIHVPSKSTLLTMNINNLSLLGWYNAVILMLSIWVGILLTYHALYPIHQSFSNKAGSFLGTIFSFAICLISSYGIYLGRFPRLNSWDIIQRPITLFNTIVASLNTNTLYFVLLFGGLVFVIYNTLYTFERR